MRRSERELEDRVVAQLTAAGLVQPEARAPIFASLAAGLAIGVAGVLGVQQIAQGGSDGRRTYFVALYERPAIGPGGNGADRAAEYGRWARTHAGGAATVVDGAELADSRPVIIGPAPSGAAALGGYFVIRATDDSAATKLAQSNPHLKYGGSIVIRPIVD